MSRRVTHPKLRWPIDIRVQDLGDGQRALVVQCPIGLTSKPLFLVPEVAPILSHFEGALSVDDILAKFASAGLQPQVLQDLIQLLDDHLFLATPRYFAAMSETKEAFSQASVRPASRAGLVYPSSAEELGKLVDGYLDMSTVATTPKGKLLCLVSPHIDYRRGGRGYGVTYPRLEGTSADVVVLIGTAHQYSPRLFHLCAKDFECPIGTFACDLDFVSKLAASYGVNRSFADEYLHKQEHSLELQLPFMARMNASAKIAPVLVGSFHRMLLEQKPPELWPEYDEFAAALAECLSEIERAGRTFSFIAGVDMAHVGRAFGDPGSLTPDGMREIARRDQEYLAIIAKGDKHALFRHMSEDHDARRICGFPTLYTILDVLSRLGKSFSCDLICYEQAVDYRSDCAVTFAGAAMYERLGEHF